MSKEEMKLSDKIRFYEDCLLREKNYRKQEFIGGLLRTMRKQLQQMYYERLAQ